MSVLEANEMSIKIASEIILAGGVVVYPTETVYGLGCDPAIEYAAKRICDLKGRDNKPLPLIASDIESVKKVVKMNPLAELCAEKFWPGPLMLILPTRVNYSKWINQGANTLGIRITSHPVAKHLTELSGGVIVSTSANLSGLESAISAQEASKTFGKKVDLILDDGVSKDTHSSTVLDLSQENPQILRVGPISRSQINEVIKKL